MSPLGQKRTLRRDACMSAFDLQRTSGALLGWLFVKALHVAGQLHPRQSVLAKLLECRCSRFRFVKRADVQYKCAGPPVRLLSDRRAAFRAEMTPKRHAAAARTSKCFHRSIDRHSLLGNDDHRTEGAASELLATA